METASVFINKDCLTMFRLTQGKASCLKERAKISIKENLPRW